MNKKSFWLYVVIMTMAVIAVVLAIFILVVTDNKKPSNQHFKEEVSSQVTKVTESEEYQYVLKYERDTLRIYRNIADEGREVFYDYADINIDSLPDDIRERLTKGIYFEGEAQLYDFLQTYSRLERIYIYMVKIISDSTSDLTKELIDKLDISVIPLHILLGNDEYRDGIDITPDKIYEWADENKTTPKTSAVSIDDTIEMFKCVLEEDRDIVAFAISEDMSTTANVFRLAARELEAEDRIHVIDSENLSTGIGHLVVEAAVMAGKGMSAADIEKNILELRPRVRASFVVDTLTYLHRGGRCSGLAAMAGGVLKLHPRIEVNNGKMNPGKKYRGRMKNVVLDYVKDMEEDLKKAKKDRVFITHSGCDKEIVDEVKNYLKQLDVFDEIYETRAGGVISSHCGPGTLGVLFIAGE